MLPAYVQGPDQLPAPTNNQHPPTLSPAMLTSRGQGFRAKSPDESLVQAQQEPCVCWGGWGGGSRKCEESGSSAGAWNQGRYAFGLHLVAGNFLTFPWPPYFKYTSTPNACLRGTPNTRAPS